MARRRAKIDEGESEINMTPMIDVVFNLIIFFMVITDMTQQELEYLILPKADLAQEDPGEDKDRLIVNIVDPNAEDSKDRVDPNLPPIFFKGRQVRDFEDLRRRLRIAADPLVYPEKEKPDGTKLDPVGKLNGKPVWPSSRALLVRCDQGQMFGWVQAIMQICTFMPGRPLQKELQESPLIYKIEIAVAEPQAAEAPGNN